MQVKPTLLKGPVVIFPAKRLCFLLMTIYFVFLIKAVFQNSFLVTMKDSCHT